MALLNNSGMDLPIASNTTNKKFLPQLPMPISVNFMSTVYLKEEWDGGVGVNRLLLIHVTCV